MDNTYNNNSKFVLLGGDGVPVICATGARPSRSPIKRKFEETHIGKAANDAQIAGTTLPSCVDLRPLCPPIYNQGGYNSCVANAACFVYKYIDTNMDTTPGAMDPSRLFAYYFARYMMVNRYVYERNPVTDSGVDIKSMMKALAKYGVSNEALWNYGMSINNRPSTAAQTQALRHKVISSASLWSLDDIKACLSQGYLVVFGFDLCPSFFTISSNNNYTMPIPPSTERPTNGHVVVCVGYNDEKQNCICANSWGTNWGENGYFYIPYEYMRRKPIVGQPNTTSLPWDFTTIYKEANLATD